MDAMRTREMKYYRKLTSLRFIIRQNCHNFVIQLYHTCRQLVSYPGRAIRTKATVTMKSKNDR